MLKVRYTERRTPRGQLVSTRLADALLNGVIRIEVKRDYRGDVEPEDIDGLIALVLELVEEVNALEGAHE